MVDHDTYVEVRSMVMWWRSGSCFRDLVGREDVESLGECEWVKLGFAM